MTHATWSDLDLRTREFHVTFKEGFIPKDREERTVAFGQELCDALKPTSKHPATRRTTRYYFRTTGKFTATSSAI